ncbi:hypothetical protein E8E12_002387 [Didymella heteroderae]|uniref:Heterokaryon incompatibility domain-containing protein n=1 Tax=Didymella heteroderae TaxID=1769908 RepID=A0A9P4WTQ4_9PLEO|nr:hypothetical protein E8E12_002387 [Didymella heteroderae]
MADRNLKSLYEALPLDADHSEIRLLLLHPAGWDEPVRCDFKVASLKDHPTYSALSYVWGREDAVHEISVWLGEVELAPDIWLESTAATDPGRCYDIPTINDTLELSPHSEQHDNEFFKALDSLPESEALLRIALFLEFMAKRSDFRQTYLFWNPAGNARLKQHWEQVLRTIPENPWFDRLWVVQEVVLAPTVIILIGPVALPLDTIARAKEAHLQHKQWPYYGGFKHTATEILLETAISPFVDIARVRKQIRDRAASLTLAELRLQLSRRAATVDHDQVFSLLGLAAYLRGSEETQASQTEVELRAPDYDSAPASIYKVITRQHIQERSNLLPLSISSHKGAHPETPSWIVDWTILQGASLSFNQLMWTKGYTLFHADRGMIAVQHDFRSPKDHSNYELQLQGCFIDRVVVSTSFATLFTENNAFLSTMRKRDPELPYPGSESTTWSDAWFRCITADSVTTDDTYYGGKKMSQPHRLHDDPDEEGFKTRARGFREGLNAQVEGVTRGRNVFLTEQGYLGVTNKCEVGDEIYIAGGGRMPIILQRYAEGPAEERAYYRVVSDCYLHGFMDGEHNVPSDKAKKSLQALNII